MHWDEGRFNQAVRDCFNALAADVAPSFGEFTTRSLAFEVVELLGWKEYADFKNDMLTLS